MGSFSLLPHSMLADVLTVTAHARWSELGLGLGVRVRVKGWGYM